MAVLRHLPGEDPAARPGRWIWFPRNGSSITTRSPSASPPRSGSISAIWSRIWPACSARASNCGRSGCVTRRASRGGWAVCGRELCCSGFLDDFVPVSLKMAKDQMLPLSPQKLSGLCGRLRCCLAYEHAGYREAQTRLPRVGATVRDGERAGTVRKVDLMREQVTVHFAAEDETAGPAAGTAGVGTRPGPAGGPRPSRQTLSAQAGLGGPLARRQPPPYWSRRLRC